MDVVAKARELAGNDDSIKSKPALLKAAAEIITAQRGGRRRVEEDEPEYTPAQRRRAQGESSKPRSEDSQQYIDPNVREMLRQMKLPEKDYIANKKRGY